jgi:hypothetical protein
MASGNLSQRKDELQDACIETMNYKL